MRKWWIGIAAVVAGLVLVGVIRERPAQKSEVASVPTAAGKQRLADFWATFRAANRFRLTGNFELAIGAYRRCLELKPAHEESLYYLGASLAQAGEEAQAAAVFEKELEQNPASGRALAQLAGIESVRRPGSTGDAERARRLYERIMVLNREQAGPYLGLGLLELDQRNYPLALRNFRVASHSGSPQGDYWAGYTLYLEGKFDAAKDSFEKAISALSWGSKTSGAAPAPRGGPRPAPGKPVSAMQGAALESELFLRWIKNDKASVPASGKFVPAGPSAEVRPGGRAAWGDYDSDGLVDLLVTRAGGPVSLYHHQGGGFVDVAEEAGLGKAEDVWDAVWTDFDADRRPDLYLIRGGFAGAGENRLYRNLGDGKFADVTEKLGLAGKRATARAIFFDANGDKRADLLEAGSGSSGREPLRLFRNERGGYRDVTAEAGLTVAGTVVDAAVADCNGDGAPDIFVLLWRKEPRLYLNDGAGRFTDSASRAGLAGIRGDSLSAVSFDYNRDRLPDLLISFQAPFLEVARRLLEPGFVPAHGALRLYENTGSGTFREVTDSTGLRRGYGVVQAVAADFDADGWKDILLANGSLDARRLETSVILRNERGARFSEWARLPTGRRPGNQIGAAVADYDGDGFPDIYVAGNPLIPAQWRKTALFRNTAGATSH